MSTAVQLTLAQFLARPEREDDQREELIEGEVVLSPGAKMSRAIIVERLREQLTELKQAGYRVANDFSCILGSHSMPIPDLAAVLKSRSDEAVKADGWLEGSPELVVEVSSPSNRRLTRKADIYLEHGAEQVWIVYPKKKTVTVVTRKGSISAPIGELLEFHGIRVPVSSLFPDA